jgi:predicted nucleotidyltransferase
VPGLEFLNQPLPTSRPRGLGKKNREIIDAFKKNLKQLYGNNLHSVILYGSLARGEETEESDIDLIVVLKEIRDFWDEVRRIDKLESRLEEKNSFGILISAIPLSLKSMEETVTPLLLNVKKEGVVI